MKKYLSHFLLSVLLLCAQVFAAAHAVEHTLEEGRGLPPHVCELCLAGHDLGAGLTGKAATPVAIAATYLLPLYRCSGRAALPAPPARQQSPPCA